MQWWSDFSAAVDRVRHCDLLFKLKFIGVGCIVLSICTEFLSDHRQRVVVDGAASEQIPIISGMPQGTVLGPLLFILYTIEMFELVDNRLFAYADDSRLLTVVFKPADRPAVAASPGTFLRFRSGAITCAWYCILVKLVLYIVVSRSRTVRPPDGDWVLSGVLIGGSPNLDILGMKFDSKLTFEHHVRGIVSLVPQRIGLMRLVKHIFVDTSVLLRCYFPFVLPILEYCSPVWGSAAECHLQLVELQVYSVARLCSDQSFLSVCHRRRVAGLSMLYKVNSNSNNWLFGELPSASTWVRHTELRPHLILWSLKYQGVERPNLHGVSWLPRFECALKKKIQSIWLQNVSFAFVK